MALDGITPISFDDFLRKKTEKRGPLLKRFVVDLRLICL
jgi:hypothetical protein